MAEVLNYAVGLGVAVVAGGCVLACVVDLWRKRVLPRLRTGGALTCDTARLTGIVVMLACVATTAHGAAAPAVLLDAAACPPQSLLNSHSLRFLTESRIRCIRPSTEDVRTAYQRQVCAWRLFRPTLVTCRKQHAQDDLGPLGTTDLEQQLRLWHCESQDGWGEDIRLRCPPQHSPCFDPLPAQCYVIYDPTSTLIYVGGSVAIVATVVAVVCCARVYIMYFAFCRVARPDDYPLHRRRVRADAAPHTALDVTTATAAAAATRHDKSA